MENIFVLWLLSRFLLLFFVFDFLYFDYVMPGRRFFFLGGAFILLGVL